MVQRNDVVLAVSYSGETREIVDLLEFIKRIDFGPGNRLAIDGQTLEIGRDFQPLEYSASTSFDFNDVIDVGYGIVTDDSSHHDYRHRDVRGKAVLIRRYVPRSSSDTAGSDTVSFAADGTAIFTVEYPTSPGA